MKYARNAVPFVRMLLDAGADPQARSAGGKTAREIAQERARLQQQEPADRSEASRKPYDEIARVLEEHLS